VASSWSPKNKGKINIPPAEPEANHYWKLDEKTESEVLT
jgi:hypothetical protein